MSRTIVSEEEKRKHSERMKELWADPEYRKKMLKAKNTEAHSKIQSKAMKKTWKNSHVRKRRSKGIALAANTEENKKRVSERIKKLRKENKVYKKMEPIYKIVRKKRIRNYGGVIEDSSLRNNE